MFTAARAKIAAAQHRRWRLEAQDGLLSFEQANDVTTGLSEFLRVFFNLGKSTVLLKFISSLMVHEPPFPWGNDGGA